MNVPIVWIMGGPGSGKSTLAEKIVQKFGFKHVDLNAMVDNEIGTNSEKGKQYAATHNAGKNVPMTEIVQMLEKEIMSNKGGLRGFVIDGYPQSKADAEVLEQTVGAPDLVIALEAEQETLDTRRSAQGTRASLTAASYIKTAPAVLAQYADKTMQINANQDADTIFQEVLPNMETIKKNHGEGISIQR